MRSGRVVLLPLVLGAVPVVATAACYGATEVVLHLSTDLTCAARLTTGIYRGNGTGFEPAPETETTNCTPEPLGAFIGTLTVVPSGSTDGRASIKAVLARNGKTPAACTEADLTDCVVATRAFSFVPHTSRRVPIRFFADCVGRKCAEGETCVAGGVCVSNEVTCQGTDCVLPEERAPADGGLGPGNDASVLPDGGRTDDTCVLEGGGDTLVSTMDIPAGNLVVAGPSALFFVAPSATDVLSVPKTGGPSATAFAIPGPRLGPAAKITALALDGTAPFVAYDDRDGIHRISAAEGESVIPTATSPVAVYAALDNTRVRLYAATIKEVFQRDGASWDKVPVDEIGGTRLLVTPNTIYVGARATTLYSIPRLTGSPAFTFPEPPAALAYDGAAVFGGGVDVSNLGKIVKLGPMGSDPVRAALPAIPKSLAFDDEFFYFAADPDIYRVPRSNTVDMVAVPIARHPPGAVVDHVAVDPGPKGCVYYWMKPSPGAAARLLIAPKSPRVNGGDGG
jgi:hypothetical protein